MVPVAGVRAFGGHGVEEDGGAGVLMWRGARARLDALAAAAQKLAILCPGARVEIKPAGVALHDRRVAARDLGSWRSSVRQLLDDCNLLGLEVLRGRRVIEVRPGGANKGVVVERLVAAGAKGWADASVVAVGDDRTDEDLFRAVAGRGLGVRVGRPSKTTAAERRLASPAAVRRFLECLAEFTCPGQVAGAKR